MLRAPGILVRDSAKGLSSMDIGNSTGRPSSAAVWTPSSLSDHFAWYKFNTGQTIVTGVSRWADNWGTSANDLVQANTGRQPLKQGDNSILFDGSAPTNCDGLKTGIITLNQPYSYVIYGKMVSWVINKLIAAASTAGAISMTTATPEITVFAGLSSTCANTNWAVGTYSMVAVVVNGASSSITVNNTAPTTGDPGSGNATTFQMSQQTSGGANIQVWESFVVNNAMSAGDIASAYAYGQAQGFCA